MNTAQDVMNRHGVLPTSAKPGRKAKAKAVTGPIWMLVQDGDRIRVEGDDDVADGEYVVNRIHDPITRGEDAAEISVGVRRDGSALIYNKTVKAIVSRNGKPVVITQAMVDALTVGRPLWESVKAGDRVRVEGVIGLSDGVHTVNRVDHDLFRGPDSIGVNIEDHGYIRNDAVKAIVTDEPVAAVPSVSEKPVWERVQIGDRIRIEGEGGSGDGIHEVTYVDDDRFRSQNHAGVRIKNYGYVTNKNVKEILPAVVAATVPEPAPAHWSFARIKAELRPGMKVRIKGDTDPAGYSVVLTDGVYEVARIDESDETRPLRVKDPASSYGGWVRPQNVLGLDGAVTGSPLIVPVRGEFLIHVDVPTIMSNRSNGEHKAVTVTRRLSDPTQAHLARELAWDGPTRFVHHEFMKLEGTDIQNWVETDSPVTCWRDTGLEVMTPKPDMVVNPMTKPILGAFVIHIAAPVLLKNRSEGRNDPVIAVRQAYSNWATDVHFARRVEWSGPTRMVHRPTTPVPGTNGRGVAFLETDAELTLFMDGREPLILRMPARQAA